MSSITITSTISSTPIFNWSLQSTAAKNGKIKAMASPTVSSPSRERDPAKRVVITGMGVVSVFGSDVDTYYDKLLDGVSGITPIHKFDASHFPVRFGGQIPDFHADGENDGSLDDCWRYCLVAGRGALHDAGLAKQVLDKMDKTRMGVLVGSGMGGVKVFSDEVETLIENGHENISLFLVPNVQSNMGSALLAMETGFVGPNYSIAAACATVNYCFIAAANHIRQGEVDVMVAGGVDGGITPVGIGAFTACRALSQRNDDPEKASRQWDRHRDGFVMSEGAGVLVMESLDHAMRRGAEVYAEFLGGAVTCDAHHMTDPHPDGLGVSSCIIKSLEVAGVAPEEVNYVNAHATSTPAGDLAELNAINKVFKNTCELKMNATKSMIGHALGAAGAMEAIATIKAIKTGWLHPTINQFDLEPNLTIDTVPNVKKQHEVNVAISNSFGFGGQNSVVVIAPFKP